MEQYIERLKVTPLWTRIALAVVIGLGLPIYLFMDEVDNTEYALEKATSDYDAIEAKFNRAKSQKNDMPELEKSWILPASN